MGPQQILSGRAGFKNLCFLYAPARNPAWQVNAGRA
jgi:hypothetical protein